MVLSGSMAVIKLSKGGETIVDDEDVELLSEFSWYKSTLGYATAYVGGGRKNFKIQNLHNFLMDTPKGFHTDHINGNKLDNRKNNLRVCSPSQNLANRGKQSNNTTGYKGVTYNPKRKKPYIAKIKFSGKHYTIGYFMTPEEASIAYQNKAKEFYGDFARAY